MFMALIGMVIAICTINSSISYIAYAGVALIGIGIGTSLFFNDI